MGIKLGTGKGEHSWRPWGAVGEDGWGYPRAVSKLLFGNVQVSQHPDLGLESEASLVEVGTHRMLSDRWDVTMVCHSEVSQSFGLQHPSRHQELQPVPKSTSRSHHTALGSSKINPKHPPGSGPCQRGLPRIDFGNVPHHLGFILIISNPSALIAEAPNLISWAALGHY